MKARALLAVFLPLSLWTLSGYGATVNSVAPTGLKEPFSVVIDDQQNIFVSDGANNRIARIDSQSGLLSTFAGSPSGESGAVDASGTQARFFNPQGMVQARGGLVVADGANHTIRLVTTAGVVSTIAGTAGTPGDADGAGTAASFRYPTSIAVDELGVLYVTDLQGKSVRKILPDDTVSTIISTDVEPGGVARGEGDDLWVAERHQIKLYDTNGVLKLTLGTGEAGFEDALDAADARFNLPNGLLWLGRNSGGLLVSDTANHVIRRVFTNTSPSIDYEVEMVAGIPGDFGSDDGDAIAEARFHFPIGLGNDPLNGGFLVADFKNNTIRRVQQSEPLPKITTPQIGIAFINNDGEVDFQEVTDRIFNNVPLIAVLAETGVQTYFSSGDFPTLFGPQVPDPGPDNQEPGAGSAPPFNLTFGGLPEEMISAANILPDMQIKAISTQTGRLPSETASARFQFIVATPQISGDNAADFTVTSDTSDVDLFYTIDGSDPTNEVSESTFLVQPGDPISITLGESNVLFRVKAFREDFQPSAVASKLFQTNDFSSTTISFGFESGEGSSKFVGAAGQTFSAPVTLTLLTPDTVINSMQFNLSVTNDVGAPAVVGGEIGFDSFLTRINDDGTVSRMPPQMFVGTFTTNTIVTVENGTTNTTTEIEPNFTNLLSTNFSINLLSVGWLETIFGQPQGSFLYDNDLQHLVSISQARNIQFTAAENGGRVLVGGFNVKIPGGAADGDKYRVRIGRPSAVRGIDNDVFVAAPTNGSLSVGGPLNSIKEITVGEPGYVVGDAAPFRWFNAGDFGDTNLLALDVVQVFEAAVYGINVPPSTSDLFDALDSSDGTIGGFMAQDGNDTVIDGIMFGDGVLEVDDVFVTWRRGTDPTLKWFRRFWSGGALMAEEIPNQFRGSEDPQLANSPAYALTPQTTASDPGEAHVVFRAGDVVAAGGTVEVPVYVDVEGDYPMSVFMFGATVVPLDGAPALESGAAFVPSQAIGAPTFSGSKAAGNFGGVWLNKDSVSISGEDVLLGVLRVDLPAGASSEAAYRVQFDKVSASPNGYGLFPRTIEDGLVTLRDRSVSSHGDEIPDAWRLRYFGSANAFAGQRHIDADFDGVPNWAEFRAGTHPNDERSSLRLLSPKSMDDGNGGSNGVSLTWATVRDKAYVIECSSSLAEGDWTVVYGPVTGTGSAMEFVEDSGLDRKRFYRVRLIEESAAQ